ncbi:MAG TPA: UbiD family decarboxylase [Chloroflexota bacterium]|nr:UbiD family decarboxylase [Chloroflexota bacterium]
MRAFLEELARRGALEHIGAELSPRYEIPYAMVWHDRRGGPALQFDRVAGYDVPVVANLFGRRERIAWALGLDGPAALLDATASLLSQPRLPVAATGPAPVQEVVHDQAPDLPGTLPVLTHHADDAYPYLTSAVAIGRDPDGGPRGVGIHRVAVKGPREIGIYLNNPPLGAFAARARERGEPLEVALVLGASPAVTLASVVPVDPGEDKLALAGALGGRAIPLTRCRTLDVEVPADAEIVVECLVYPDRREPEGPFGETTGYYCTFESPVGEVRAITHRARPLYHAFAPFSREVSELSSFSQELRHLPALRAEFPGVRRLRYKHLGGVAVVQIAKEREDDGLAVLRRVLALGRGLKLAIAVDEDVDPEDDWLVEWAIATRAQPDRGLVVLENQPLWSIDVVSQAVGRRSKLGIDATLPLAGRERFRALTVPDDARRRVETLLGGQTS